MTDLTSLTTQCIRCGFCLEACPTFVVTGKETESPRGRIYLVRSAEEGVIDWEEARPSIDLCLGCRACETACPSGVKYGEILELARDRLESERPNYARRKLLDGLTSPGALKVQLALARLTGQRRMPAWLSRAISGQEPQADLPATEIEIDLPEVPQTESKGEVYMLEGCAMRTLYPRVHQATRRLLKRIGFEVREVDQGCCGSLYAHNGHLAAAAERAESLIAAMPDDLPVIVNSAGCGSTMREYGELLGTDAAESFGRRCIDASVFLERNGIRQELAESNGYTARLAYHDACHLAHGQRVSAEPRKLLAAIPGIQIESLPESDMCCGSAGVYNLTQPAMARQLVERKIGNAHRCGAQIVATGNPGCHAWIAQAARENGEDIRVMHTMEALEASFVGLACYATESNRSS